MTDDDAAPAPAEELPGAACRCCGLPEGHDMIEFDKDCKWENFMSPNFTAIALRTHTQRAHSIEARMPVPQQQQASQQPGGQREEWPQLRRERLLSARNGS